jgi:hypothetical protein
MDFNVINFDILMNFNVWTTSAQDDDILQKSKSIDGCLKYFFRNFFVQAFFFIGIYFFISYLTIIVDY